MDGIQHDEVVLAPQRGKLTFLDLPGELRNAIYRMLSQPALAYERRYLFRGEHDILNGLDERVAIPAIASTNRQIRTEFLSQELPNHLIVVRSDDPAHYCNTRLDNIFKRYLSHLLIIGPDIRPQFLPNETHPNRQSMEIWDKEFVWPRRFDRIRLRAEHTDNASKPARTQFLFTFFFTGPQAMMFIRDSDSAIRNILTDIYSGNRTSSCVDLIQAVDRLKELRLSTCVDWPRTAPTRSFRLMGYRYIILDSPRRLRVATSCTYHSPFQNGYKLLDEGDGEFHYDELL